MPWRGGSAREPLSTRVQKLVNVSQRLHRLAHARGSWTATKSRDRQGAGRRNRPQRPEYVTELLKQCTKLLILKNHEFGPSQPRSCTDWAGSQCGFLATAIGPVSAGETPAVWRNRHSHKGHTDQRKLAGTHVRECNSGLEALQQIRAQNRRPSGGSRCIYFLVAGVCNAPNALILKFRLELRARAF